MWTPCSEDLFMATLGERVETMWSGDGEMVCAITGDQGDRPWALSKLTFVCSGVVGRLIGDTGASLTLVSKSFVERTKLVVEEMEIKTSVQMADGRKCPLVGRVDLPISIQLMVELEGGVLVHWDRGYTLANVVVADLGVDAPRDLYIAYKDFATGPLAQLVEMIQGGAKVLDTPRAPKPGLVLQPLAVEIMTVDMQMEAGDVVKGAEPKTQDLPDIDMVKFKEMIVEEETLTVDEAHELKVYGLLLTGEGVAGPTVVPGHQTMAPMVAKIVEAQKQAGHKEREAWTGSRFKTVSVGDQELVLFDGKMVVPQEAKELKEVLMRLAHDDQAHYAGGERTAITLERQAKVWWFSLRRDVTEYVKSCFKCQMVRHPHGEPGGGSLQPTLAETVHNTWYVDIKGPMPEDTGYLMLVVEAFSRVCKLRYLPRANTKEVCEEMHEVMLSFGTRPRVLRCDGGPPFDGNEFKAWCKEQGIEVVKGLPGHSRGQGMVETRFKGIADALMASLGGKAPTAWYKGDFLMRLEGIMNSTAVSSVGGSPWWVLTGFEPRTPLAALTDWTNADFGRDVMGDDKLTHEDYCNAIAALHEHINKVQGRALMASSLAQAITKTDWNKRVKEMVFKVDDWVLLHRVAPNRMLPHFTGPFKVLRVVGDGNSVLLAHYLEPEKQEGPVHVARLLPFDMTRATSLEIAAHQLEEGSSIVEAVVDHRQLGDGSMEFKIKWLNYPIETWVDSKRLTKVKKALEYCRSKGIPEPGKEKRNVVRPKVDRARRGT